MIQVRKSKDRGMSEQGWLRSQHTFSFGEYHDESFRGFGVMRVINEDVIQGNSGFGTHPHTEMEIISYVVDGELLHEDSMGNSTIIRRGDVQRMSAGSGISHSEKNNLKDRETHFLQLWFFPERKGVTPSYGQKSFGDELAKGDLVLVVSKDGQGNSVKVNQDLKMYAATTTSVGERRLTLEKHRDVWIQVVKGELTVDGTVLSKGDGAGVVKVNSVDLHWKAGAEFLVFDLPRLS